MTMEPFAKNIRALLDRERLTQQRFADSIGLSITTVNGWLKRGVQPKAFNLETIRKVYGVSLDDLLSDQNGLYAKLHGLTKMPPGSVAVKPVDSVMVPVRVLGTVHAGDPDEGFEAPEDFAPLPAELSERHPHAYALKVNGTCMNRFVSDRSMVFCDPDMRVQDGSVGVFLLDGTDYIVRRAKIGANSVMLCPDSFDPKWEDIVVQGDCRTLEERGVVFWFQSEKEME